MYGYICVGNGYNDITMFKKALDDGMVAAIMGNASKELIREVRDYAGITKKGRVILLPKTKDLANKKIYKMAKIYETYIRTQERGEKRKRKRKRDKFTRRISQKPYSIGLQFQGKSGRNDNGIKRNNNGRNGWNR